MKGRMSGKRRHASLSPQDKHARNARKAFNASGATMHVCRIRKLLALRCGARMRRGLATAACCLIMAPSAAAEVKRAESIMPPGQSGFVAAPCLVDSSACDPHLTDQISLFTEFEYKNSMLGQPGAEETPKAGVRIVS